MVGVGVVPLLVELIALVELVVLQGELPGQQVQGLLVEGDAPTVGGVLVDGVHHALLGELALLGEQLPGGLEGAVQVIIVQGGLEGVLRGDHHLAPFAVDLLIGGGDVPALHRVVDRHIIGGVVGGVGARLHHHPGGEGELAVGIVDGGQLGDVARIELALFCGSEFEGVPIHRNSKGRFLVLILIIHDLGDEVQHFSWIVGVIKVDHIFRVVGRRAVCDRVGFTGDHECLPVSPFLC